MTPSELEQLIGHLDGTLPPEVRAGVERRLAESPEWSAELERLRAVRGLLRASAEAAAEHAVRPFLAERVLRRLDAARARMSPEEEFFSDLLRVFRPVVLAGLLAIAAIAGYNLTLADDYGAEPTATEAVLALPPETLTTAYEADLYLAR